jgi:hypothetical protein
MSEKQRQFKTGSVRDNSEGKGRCDLLPACALLRLAKHYEEGSKKYGDRNWERGQPISVLIDSGMRHLLKYMDGRMDEDHLTAAVWNLIGAMWMEEKIPELQDLPSRVSGYRKNLNKKDESDTIFKDNDLFPSLSFGADHHDAFIYAVNKKDESVPTFQHNNSKSESYDEQIKEVIKRGIYIKD